MATATSVFGLRLPLFYIVTLFSLPFTALMCTIGLLLTPLTVSFWSIHQIHVFSTIFPLYFILMPFTLPVGFCIAGKRLVMFTIKATLHLLTLPISSTCILIGGGFWQSIRLSTLIIVSTIVPWKIPDTVVRMSNSG